MTETEALKAFNAASNELQTALAKYQGARTELHRITGKFAGIDPALSLQFSSACAGLPGTDATNTSNSTALADC